MNYVIAVIASIIVNGPIYYFYRINWFTCLVLGFLAGYTASDIYLKLTR